MHKAIRKNFLYSPIIILLSACGGGGEDHDDVSKQVLSGQIIDAPIHNLHYRTASRSGVTSSDGSFSYLAGEEVIFSIGNIEFPAVAAGETLTPLDLVGTSDIDNEYVSNIIRFLQSVDSDGDTSNGISIPTLMHDSATTNISFERSAADFESDSEVSALMSSYSYNSGSLVSAATAKNHFETQLSAYDVIYGPLVGTWTENSSADNELSLYGFLQNGVYFHIQYDTDLPASVTNGAEMGTYSVDNSNADLVQTSVVYDDNGSAGLTGSITLAEVNAGGSGSYFTYTSGDDSSLTLTETVYVAGVQSSATSTDWSRVSSADSALVGTWSKTKRRRHSYADDIYVFLASGQYIKIDIEHHSGDDDDGDDNEFEWGSYIWDSANQLLTLSSYAGFDDDDSNTTETYNVIVGDNIMTLTDSGDDDRDIFVRM